MRFNSVDFGFESLKAQNKVTVELQELTRGLRDGVEQKRSGRFPSLIKGGPKYSVSDGGGTSGGGRGRRREGSADDWLQNEWGQCLKCTATHWPGVKQRKTGLCALHVNASAMSGCPYFQRKHLCVSLHWLTMDILNPIIDNRLVRIVRFVRYVKTKPKNTQITGLLHVLGHALWLKIPKQTNIHAVNGR